MAKAKLYGEDIVGVESVEYTFEPFRYDTYNRANKSPVVVKGSPQLRTVRVSGKVSTDQVSIIQGFEDREPSSFTSPIVTLTKCVVKRIRMSQSGNDFVNYTIELQEVDDFVEVGQNG